MAVWRHERCWEETEKEKYKVYKAYSGGRKRENR